MVAAVMSAQGAVEALACMSRRPAHMFEHAGVGVVDTLGGAVVA